MHIPVKFISVFLVSFFMLNISSAQEGYYLNDEDLAYLMNVRPIVDALLDSNSFVAEEIVFSKEYKKLIDRRKALQKKEENAKGCEFLLTSSGMTLLKINADSADLSRKIGYKINFLKNFQIFSGIICFLSTKELLPPASVNSIEIGHEVKNLPLLNILKDNNLKVISLPENILITNIVLSESGKYVILNTAILKFNKEKQLSEIVTNYYFVYEIETEKFYPCGSLAFEEHNFFAALSPLSSDHVILEIESANDISKGKKYYIGIMKNEPGIKFTPEGILKNS